MPIDLARLPVEIGFILAHPATAHEFTRELQVRKADRHRATTEYLIKDVGRAPACQWDRLEHRPHCRHDDRPEMFWAGLINRRARASDPRGAPCRAGKSVPHPPRFSLSAAEPEVRIHLSPAASQRIIFPA